jgi:predicted nucleotidyltransferase
MNFGLKEETILKIISVFERFPQIEKAILYGSRAKGNFKEGSDIDLTLIGENLDLTLINKIETEIDDLLLPYTFDISIYHQLDNPELINHIKRVGKTFYFKSN